MEKLSMCRICLATDVRLCSIASHLRDMFERISSMTFKREDRRPLVACYICYAQLQNCYRLRTSCIQSEELLTEMLSSGELKPQDMLSTNSFRVVSALHLSLGPVLQDSTECHLSDDISDAELDQLYTEDIVMEAQEEKCALIEVNNERSHVEYPLDIIKEEADDVEADAEYIKLEEGNIKLEEIDWKPDIAGPSLQQVDVICPKIVKVVMERIDLNDFRVDDPVSKKITIAALKDTKDATMNERKIEVIKNEQTETITFEEPKIVTKKIEVEKPVTTSEILETSVVISVVNDVCKQKSTNDASLKQNVSSSKGKLFSCDTCNKCFSKKGDLNRHILTHTGDKPYQCIVCNKCFSQKVHLKSHVRIHTGDKPYYCNVCNKGFSRKGYLESHIRKHSGEKPYQCNICNKCFTQKGVLNNHIRIHSGDKPNQCNVCYKCFTRKCDLEIHISIHNRDKPYQCNICNKCFSKKGDLKRHILTHSDDKPYRCIVCKKCFNHEGNLKRHIRIHSGEKPYQCNVCKKCFSDRSSYLKHIPIHKH